MLPSCLRPLLPLALFLAAAILFGPVKASLRANPPKKWNQAQWKVPKDQYDEITAVNLKAQTVNIHHVGGKQTVEHTLTVNAFTEIQVGEKPATLADLKPKMRVDYSLGGDGTSLSRLATLAPAAPPPTPVPTATPSFPHH